MSWGNKYTRRQPDVAFKSATASGITGAIQAMANMQFKMHKYDFTPHDLLRLFVAPERRDVLTQAYEIAAPQGYISELYVTIRCDCAGGSIKAPLRFHWDHRRHPDAWMVPNDAGSTAHTPVTDIQPDCPEELRATFMRTLTDMADISYRFGLCSWVFQNLNLPAVCKTAPQLRYYWPAVLPLLRRSGHKDQADQLAEPSTRAGQAAKLPDEVMPYLKETNETLARAHFLDIDQVNAVTLKMDYRMREVSFLGNKFVGLV